MDQVEKKSFLSLAELGWSEPFRAAFAARGQAGEIPGRVIEEQRGAYLVQTDSGEWLSRISGRMRHASKKRMDYPAVGDWVALSLVPDEKKATLLAILPRTSLLSRKSIGQESDDQLIAANLDTVFVVTALNKDFNLRRLERYLALTANSGAETVILLSKADLVPDADVHRRDVQTALPRVAVLAISAAQGMGLKALDPYLQKGKTVALIGSSGVGKSTLVNRLSGFAHQAVQEVRARDDSGRHTTTSRRMISLPQGGLLIDTPGMRDLQITESDGVDQTFTDIIELMQECRFQNCRHTTDTGCAVQAAIQKGVLAPGRYTHYLQLQKEADELIQAREAEAHAKANEKFNRTKSEYRKERRRKDE